MVILFISGVMLGAVIGVLLMALIQINHDKEEE